MSEPFQLKPNSGNQFRNENKKTDAHPDYTGKLDVDGKLYSLSAWLNESKSGKKYLGVKISEFEPRTEQAAQPTKATDDIPF